MKIEYGLPKSVIQSQSNYSPWLTNDAFNESYSLISSISAVDILRCYELWTIVSRLKKISGDIIEVGTWKGGTGILLGLASRHYLSNRQIYLCDTFEGVVKAGPNDPFYRGGEFSDTDVETVQKRVDENKIENISLLKGIFPDATGHLIEDKKFCFAHIDVDVYESARDSFEWIWPRLSPGGIVVFDDYGWVDCAGVIKFVNEEVVLKDNCTLIHNLNGHAIAIKLNE